MSVQQERIIKFESFLDRCRGWVCRRNAPESPHRVCGWMKIPPSAPHPPALNLTAFAHVAAMLVQAGEHKLSATTTSGVIARAAAATTTRHLVCVVIEKPQETILVVTRLRDCCGFCVAQMTSTWPTSTWTTLRRWIAGPGSGPARQRTNPRARRRLKTACKGPEWLGRTRTVSQGRSLGMRAETESASLDGLSDRQRPRGCRAALAMVDM
jgi:hypothetical protein